MTDMQKMTEEEILETIKDGLKIEGEGILTFIGRRVIITPITNFEGICLEGIDVLGLNGFKAMMYRAGLYMGEKVGVYLKDTLKMEGDDLVYFYSMTAGKGRGWGAAEVVEHDIKNGKYIARLTGSPWAAPFKDKKLPSSVCSFSCGAVAGVMMAAGSPQIVMEETKCEAKGDDCCEMISRLK